MTAKLDAVSKLGKLRNEIQGLKARATASSPEFKKWQLDTQSAIENLFPHKIGHVHRFNSIVFLTSIQRAATNQAASQSAFTHGMDEAGAILDSMIGEINDYWAEAGPSNSIRRGMKVFIGHGRSALWKELKDFLHERLGLAWDEFNRVPIAGIPNTQRLLQMLDEAAIAFVIMTAEEELSDGSAHARMNVVHEVGLFQGRLGFSKAIVLLESGCSQFTNIEGLGQIRFPKGNISAAFEDIRRILEREGLIAAA